MKFNTESSADILANQISSFFQLQDYKSIIDFALQDIDLSQDVSAEKSRIDLENAPHLRQPLSKLEIQREKRKQVVICFPEQMGKTLCQMVALLYNACYNKLQAIICYPSLQLAVETSNVKFIPLFKQIDQFREQIEKPFAIRSDRLKLSNAIIYWQGAGSKIVSKSAKLVLGDETAIWNTPNNVNNIQEMKKRTRSYKQCLQVFVSTPHYKQDNLWRQFLNGSQGYYYLRCQNCGQLTMRSADIHNLQFETVYNEQLKQYIAVKGSERLVCPACKYQHLESDREQLIKQGGYQHKFSDRIDLRPSYQCGVLASLLNVHSWQNIADIQLASGKGATLQDYVSFDNSIRGLPYQQRDYNKQDQTAISKHFFKASDLKAQDIECVIISADTQDTFSVVGVFALTRQGNIYCLSISRPKYLWLDDEQRKIIDAENKRNGKQPEITVLDMLEKQYYGFKPLCLLVDMRGHRTEQIKAFSKMRKNILMYGGTNLKYDKFKLSENIPKLFLCDAKKFQSELIFMLYYQNNKESNYLYLTENLTKKDIEQITSFQPDTEKRSGNMFENWVCGDKVHDCFDLLKMAIACIQIVPKIYKPDKFRHNQARVLQRKKVDHKAKRKQTANNNKLRFI